MNIQLRNVTADNYKDIFRISIPAEQFPFVVNPIKSLAICYAESHPSHPFAIYNGNELIGYIMIAKDYELPDYGIWHFTIDEKYQNKGFGRAVLYESFRYIETLPFGEGKQISLTCHTQNARAIHLYESVGFVKSGQLIDGEYEMIRPIIQS